MSSRKVDILVTLLREYGLYDLCQVSPELGIGLEALVANLDIRALEIGLEERKKRLREFVRELKDRP